MAKAMFGAGCFWGVEYNFSKVKELNETFLLVCSKLCGKKLIIAEKIKDLEPKNESQQ